MLNSIQIWEGASSVLVIIVVAIIGWFGLNLRASGKRAGRTQVEEEMADEKLEAALKKALKDRVDRERGSRADRFSDAVEYGDGSGD